MLLSGWQHSMRVLVIVSMLSESFLRAIFTGYSFHPIHHGSCGAQAMFQISLK